MIIDIHIHEKTYSSDSQLSLEEIVQRAKSMGIDGICITDHDSNQIKEKAESYSACINYPIFVGAEVYTLEGDILVFGLDTLPNTRIPAKELLELVAEKGGVAIAAHPYRENNRGVKDHLRILPRISGIEGLNGSTNISNNLKALRTAREMNIPLLGGSDAHNLYQLGRYATIFPDHVRDEKDFIEAVKSGETQMAEYTEAGYKAFLLDIVA